MPRSEHRPLTKLELQIMQVIWRRGDSTVSEVQESLDQQLAYTTIQTMLNILHRKRKLKRQTSGRAFIYSAAVTEEKASTHALKDLVDRVFGGSSEDLVMSLIKSRQIDPEKIAELTRKLEEEEGSR
jgi:predicted transcriptional regulator